MTKSARLDLRLEPELKTLLEQAARLQNSSLSDFASGALLEKARAVVEQHRRITLPAAAFDALAARLEEPARPLPRLREQLRKARR